MVEVEEEVLVVVEVVVDVEVLVDVLVVVVVEVEVVGSATEPSPVVVEDYSKKAGTIVRCLLRPLL